MKLVFFIWLLITLPTRAEIFETQIEQTSPQTGDFSEYRLWVSPGSHPNQILVTIWGSNQCSLGEAEDDRWRKLAGSMHCALLACCFFPQTSRNRWDHADEGSGAALLEAIRSLALKSSETQLANASLYLVGDSQGGQFAFSFAASQPSRTLGFASLKGGQHDFKAIPGAAGVPGLFVAGQLDAPFRIANIEEIFSKGRLSSAPWCLAMEPHGAHDPAHCGELLGAFLHALAQAHSAQKVQDLGLVEKGELQLPAIPLLLRSWFPDSTFKKDWERFESGVMEASSPSLDFNSRMPTSVGMVTPTSLDLGSIASGNKSVPFSLNVSPNGVTDWDNISIVDCPYVADSKIVKVPPDHFIVYARLNTTELPLGRFSEVVPLRFSTRNKPILGGVNVPVVANLIGDVAASPPLINLGAVHAQSTVSVTIQISSKAGMPVSCLSCEIPKEVKTEFSLIPANPLTLTFSFAFGEESSDQEISGFILLHLKTTKEWTLRVPYIGSFAH